ADGGEEGQGHRVRQGDGQGDEGDEDLPTHRQGPEAGIVRRPEARGPNGDRIFRPAGRLLPSQRHGREDRDLPAIRRLAAWRGGGAASLDGMPAHTPRAADRRDFLFRAGGGLGGIALSWLVSRDAHAAPPTNPLAAKKPHFDAKAKSVIFMFMVGGPSAIDLF